MIALPIGRCFRSKQSFNLLSKPIKGREDVNDSLMRQTLCYIPETLFGFPLFGWGWGLVLLIAVIIVSHCYQYIRHRKISDIGSSLALLGIGGIMLIFIVPNLAEPEHGIPIRGYGFCLLLAILAALTLVIHLAKRQNIAAETVYSLCFWAVIAGIIGARLFYVTEYWQETFLDHSGEFLSPDKLLFNVLNFAQGGLVVYGSILGGILGSLIFMLRNKMPVLRTFDIMAPAAILGIAIGRIGCLLNGCCFGGITDVSWGIVFPAGSPAHIRQAAHGDVFFYGLKFKEINIGEQKILAVAEVQPGSDAESQGLKPERVLWHIPARDHEGKLVYWTPTTCLEAAQTLAHLQAEVPDGKIRFDFFTNSSHTEAASFWLAPPQSEVLPVHPTQIYSSCLALLLCGTLLLLGKLRFYQQRGGLVFASFMIFYSVGRFIIEIIRTDEDSFLGTGLTISQNVSIGVCLAGIILFIYLSRNKSIYTAPRQ